MPPRLSLDTRQARALHLAAQGLLVPPPRRATKEDVLGAIARMSLLQIDTIHVVARSPYLVLFSRLGPYEPAWLDERHAPSLRAASGVPLSPHFCGAPVPPARLAPAPCGGGAVMHAGACL